MLSYYDHVSAFWHMLLLILFLAYSEHNVTNDFKPPKLVNFVNSKLIIYRNIFITSILRDVGGGRCCNYITTTKPTKGKRQQEGERHSFYT